jgi:hypothetical protein
VKTPASTAFFATLSASIFLCSCVSDIDSYGNPSTGPGNGSPSGADPSVPSWSIQYEGQIVPRGKDYHIVDLFEVSSTDIARLKSSGSRPIAYFSSQYEKWRPDAKLFPQAALGRPLGSWPGERWVDTTSPAVRAIMRKRMDLARSRGFYGVDVDNIDGYESGTGFRYGQREAAEWVKFLAAEAHSRGLKFGLKNAIEIIPAVRGSIDYYVNEEAHQYGQISAYRNVGRPVFNTEYRPLKRGTPGIYSIYKAGAVMDSREVVIPVR